MNGETIQPEVLPPPAGRRSVFLVVVAIAVIVAVAALVWLGDWAIKREAAGPSAPLTDAQKAEILKSLQLPPGAKPLTSAQKTEIMKSLQLPPGAVPLTNAQKAEIMKSLK